VTIEIDEIIERRAAVRLRWAADAQSVRSLRLVEKRRESEDVTSFHFEARDGGPLPAFEPGQHLPIEIATPGAAQPVRRTYSLSSAPQDDHYRITVKREPDGLVSRHLHDAVDVGAVIESRAPAGDFMLTCNLCPLVLISAGVGITPMVSMLHAAARDGSDRPVWFVHGARDGKHHPLADEVRRLAAARPNTTLHVAYSRPHAEDRIGETYHSAGRIDGALLARLGLHDDAHVFLCGPPRFMAETQTELERLGISADRIHTETFGPITGPGQIEEYRR